MLRASYKENGQPVREGEGVSEGIHDAAIFSLTDFVGKLLPDTAPCQALSIAFLKDPEKTRLDSILSEEYTARKAKFSGWEINMGIERFQ